MDKHPINDLMGTVMDKLRDMADVSTVIGESIVTPDGITLIPISRVSMGFASGGSDFTGKHQKDGQASPFGAGTGGSVKIDPVAFVVIKEGIVRVMTIEPPASTTVDRIIDTAPEIVDKITAIVDKKKAEKAEKAAKEAAEEALPEVPAE